MWLWKKIHRFVLDVLFGHSIDKNLIVLRSDGGISSQIAFWALGKSYEDQGYKLKYDLSWFEECGKDMDGVFDRNFDLQKAFPKLSFDIASKQEVYHYQRHFKSSEKDINDIAAPAYLGDYYNRWPLFIKYRAHIKQYFEPDNLNFDSYNDRLLLDISQHKNACAVHVRRGDLGVYNKFYGEPLGADYFVEAVERVLDEFPSTFFYFFSDESDWIEENILPKLSSNIQYELVVGNGSDKGYLDLYLMSLCQSFISSHGSLAKYARVLSSDDALIVEPESQSMFKDELSNNVIVI